MNKKEVFDYVKYFEEAVKEKHKELYVSLSNMDGHFAHHNGTVQTKFRNPHIWFYYEHGEENSYINIMLGDYDSNDTEEKFGKVIGWYYAKDYQKHTAKLFELMYYLQVISEELSKKLFWNKI
jgi:hypothetical protein